MLGCNCTKVRYPHPCHVQQYCVLYPPSFFFSCSSPGPGLFFLWMLWNNVFAWDSAASQGTRPFCVVSLFKVHFLFASNERKEKKKKTREPVSVATQYKKLLLSPSLPPIFSHSFQPNHSSFLDSQSSLADLQKEASILSPSPTLRLISSHLLFAFCYWFLLALSLSLFPLPNPHPIPSSGPTTAHAHAHFSWTEYGTPYPHSFSHQCQVPVSFLAAYPISFDSCACFRLITSCRRQQGPLFRHASKEAFNSSRFPLCFF